MVCLAGCIWLGSGFADWALASLLPRLYMTLLQPCRLGFASLLSIVLHSLPLGVFVVTVDVDVVVDVDVDCGRCRKTDLVKLTAANTVYL